MSFKSSENASTALNNRSAILMVSLNKSAGELIATGKL